MQEKAAFTAFVKRKHTNIFGTFKSCSQIHLQRYVFAEGDVTADSQMI